MGDHGGGQKELAEVAKPLDAKYSPQGSPRGVLRRCVRQGRARTSTSGSRTTGYPVGAHASIKDTSELLYLGGRSGLGSQGPDRDRGWRPWWKGRAAGSRQWAMASAAMRGTPSPEIGKVVSDMKVNYAVAQIRQLLECKTGGWPQ